jgi:type III pantothenate kinase
MYILGDIGNTETKIYLVTSKYKILKKLTFSSKNINQKKLNKILINFKVNYKNLKKYFFVAWFQNLLI